MATPPQGPPSSVPTPPQPAAVVPSVTPDIVDLPSGNELDDLGAAKLQAAQLTRLIVVAGPVGAGKTTLLATLHDLFQEGKVGGFSFAWSKTLPAFERRCHFNRTASERSFPETERTKIGEVRYLHIQISSPELPDNLLDLLLMDVNGETFEQARDSIRECQRLDFLRMADHFLLLIDCEKIIDRRKRNQAIHDATMLLRSCLDSGMLAPSSFVTVLWTKYDFIAVARNGEHASFLEKATQEFQRQFGSRVGRLSFKNASARPPDVEGLDFGYGLPELLQEWATESPRNRIMNLLPDQELGSRESEKFLKRHFDSVSESK